MSKQCLSVTGAPGVVFPKALAFDCLAADGAGELARVGVLGVGVLDAPGSALCAEESAGVGHSARLGIAIVKKRSQRS